MNSIYFYFITVFLLFFIGYGINAILLSEKFKKSYIWFTPWVGTILIILISIISSLAKEATSRSMYLVFIISGLSLLYSTIVIKRLNFLTRQNVIISGFFILGLYLLAHLFNPPEISEKITAFQSLAKVSIGTSLIEGGSLDIGNSNLGSALILSFFSNILGKSAEHLFNNLSWIYFFLSYPLLLIFIRNFYKKKELYITAVTFCVYLFIIFFLPLRLDSSLYIGIGLLISNSLISLFTHRIRRQKYSFIFAKNEIVLGMCLSALTVINPLSFKATLGIVIGIFIVHFLLNKDAKYTFQTLIRISLLLIFINPVMVGIALGFR